MSMDKFDALLNKLNSVKIKPTSIGCWEEDIADFNKDFFESLFEKDEDGKIKYKVIKEEDIDGDRDHQIGITIIKIHGRYLEITHVTDCSGHRSIYEYLDKLKFREVFKNTKKVTSFT